MGWGSAATEQIKQLIEKFLELHKEMALINNNFSRLEQDVQKFDVKYRELFELHTALRERTTILEARFEAAISASIRDAMTQVLREQVIENGELPKMNRLDAKL
jgi:predicted nuclease with TOPRIM domain